MIIYITNMRKIGKGDLWPRFRGQDTEDITVKWPIQSYCSKIEFDLLHLIPTH